ncbi:MAG: hypothetical protein GF329_16490 [Candidatus Lokiarchaeota archaeon]|nr:hypothetical protein [Candidatus Lokiarchaeota archaeon]
MGGNLLVYVLDLEKDEITTKDLNIEEFTDDVYKKLNEAILAGIDINTSDNIDKISSDEYSKFEKEVSIIESFFDLKQDTLLEYLKKTQRPSFYVEDSTSIIVLPYFSALKHVNPDQEDEFIPIETTTNHFLILFKKPNKIATIRTDPRNFSLECVQIVMNWARNIDLKQEFFDISSDLLDQAVLRLIDEIIDDNVEVIRRFRMNVEFLEQDIIRKSARSGIIDEILKLKSISMLLYSYVLSERRFINRIKSSAFPSIKLTKDVLGVIQTTLNEIDNQTGIINDVNRMISDILNIYSLMLQDRLNNVIKILTIFSVSFTVPSFIVGFFGMNNFAVDYINPFFTVEIIITIIISLIVPLILLWRFKMFKKISF